MAAPRLVWTLFLAGKFHPASSQGFLYRSDKAGGSPDVRQGQCLGRGQDMGEFNTQGARRGIEQAERSLCTENSPMC